MKKNKLSRCCVFKRERERERVYVCQREKRGGGGRKGRAGKVRLTVLIKNDKKFLLQTVKNVSKIYFFEG